ncbi:MAG TPA: VOC family protein, partial [Thermomicrobiales bacterium]|nr:VOC family protein [Thermomicrobiales bacterium]
MPRPLLGLHHVTAICSDPQRNVDFYTRVLGLRLVKQTVDYDDPTTWHLYYGDTLGQPGTVLTFFAWPDAPGGQVGLGQFASVTLAIPAGALGYWIERLIGLGIAYQQPVRRFGERVLAFRDPDGLHLELVAVADPPPSTPWSDSTVPVDQAIRGLHGVSLWRGSSATTDFFTDQLAFRPLGGEGSIERLVGGTGAQRARLDLIGATGLWDGTVAVGTIHHVALAVPDADELLAWQSHLRGAGLDVTEVRDRTYFQS